MSKEEEEEEEDWINRHNNDTNNVNPAYLWQSYANHSTNPPGGLINLATRPANQAVNPLITPPNPTISANHPLTQPHYNPISYPNHVLKSPPNYSNNHPAISSSSSSSSYNYSAAPINYSYSNNNHNNTNSIYYIPIPDQIVHNNNSTNLLSYNEQHLYNYNSSHILGQNYVMSSNSNSNSCSNMMVMDHPTSSNIMMMDHSTTIIPSSNPHPYHSDYSNMGNYIYATHTISSAQSQLNHSHNDMETLNNHPTANYTYMDLLNPTANYGYNYMANTLTASSATANTMINYRSSSERSSIAAGIPNIITKEKRKNSESGDSYDDFGNKRALLLNQEEADEIQAKNVLRSYGRISGKDLISSSSAVAPSQLAGSLNDDGDDNNDEEDDDDDGDNDEDDGDGGGDDGDGDGDGDHGEGEVRRRGRGGSHGMRRNNPSTTTTTTTTTTIGRQRLGTPSARALKASVVVNVSAPAGTPRAAKRSATTAPARGRAAAAARGLFIRGEFVGGGGTSTASGSSSSSSKDRHSKVHTSKGLRDRRVRLSVSTALQFYDIQDRLGFQQPSRVFEWLIDKAKPAIQRLPPSSSSSSAPHPPHTSTLSQ